MAELFFIATTIFVAYVVFVVMAEKKEGSETTKPGTPIAKAESAATEAPQVEIQVPEKIAPAVARAKSPAVKPSQSKSTIEKPAAATTETAPVATPKVATAAAKANDSLKNPKTGEVAKVPSSYSFAKRWIKEALVEEGLLDKIYKNTELDEATNAKIHNALQQLKSLDKYR